MLVCVDGTGASDTAEYARIFARSFVNRVKNEYLRAHPPPDPTPIHHRGPGADTTDAMFGSFGGVHHVSPRFVLEEILVQRAALCETRDEDVISMPGSHTDICWPVGGEGGEDDPRTKIYLVGHSRGGAILIDVANMLNRRHIPVEAMFLFDAVDRSSELTGGEIPSNVGFCYHAMRDPTGNSRGSFGNCGTEAAGGVIFFPEHFMTTHGGMGGTPWGRTNPDDITSFGTITEHDPGGVTILTPEMEATGMRAVENWMWPHLRRHGVVP